MPELLGVVLCGGQSKRMGRDKGLMPIQDSCWARHVASGLEALQLPFVASVNPAQLEAYRQVFPEEQMVVDQVAAVEGPLQGLLSVHSQYPEHDLLLIACDMIDMEEATLGALVAAWQADPSADYFAYQSNDFLEPFGAVYTAAGLARVMQLAATGALEKFSLMRLLKSGNTRTLSLENSNSFRNYNTLSPLS